MVLVISNSEDVTADYLTSVLLREGLPFVRVDTDKIVDRISFRYSLGQPEIRFGNTRYQPTDFTAVWYRRPEPLKCTRFGNSPEEKYILEEWTEALEAFFAHIPKTRWINHPSCNVGASQKLEQLTIAKSLGFITPDTLVTQDPDELRAFFQKYRGNIIVKPMASGCIERRGETSRSLIYTNRVSSDDLHNIDDLKACPTLFQQYVEKRCDVRVTIVDGMMHAIQLLACEETGLQRCDIRRNNMDDVVYHPVELPPNVEHSILHLMRFYGLRFAAIDMAVDFSNCWFFLEVNPNGQWAWLDLVGATQIAKSFVTTFRNQNHA